MPATHNIVVAEEYESNGQTKTKWTTIGVIIETEKDGKKRKSVKLNLIPTGWDGFASIFAIDKDRKQDGRRDATPDDHASASDDMNQGAHTNDSLNVDDLPDDQPIDLSEIPF
jgi:hypothetical protein